MHHSGTITGGKAPKFSFRYETVWRGASGRGRTQAEALANKRGKAQRDCNKAQQGERHIFGGVEPMLCLLVECAQHKIPAEGDQNVSRAQEEQWPPQTSQVAHSDSEGQQRQQIGEEQCDQEEPQDAALQRNLADDDAQPDDQSDMDQMRGGEGQAQGSRLARQPGKGWAEQDGHRAAGIGKPEKKERPARRDAQPQLEAIGTGAVTGQNGHGKRERAAQRADHPNPCRIMSARHRAPAPAFPPLMENVGLPFPPVPPAPPLPPLPPSIPAVALAKAWSMSAMMSSMCSIPMDRRIVSGRIPAFTSSSSDSWRWVVEAGWMARVLASPRLSSRLTSWSASKKASPAS